MDFILCSAAFVICLALQVSSQLPAKPNGEWHYDRYGMYPNPWVDFTKCKTQRPSGLCDYNAMLTEEQRNYFSEQRELQVSDANGCLCNQTCGANIGFMATVAVMKKIGPGITDYRAAAKEFAERFRESWNLNSCSLILVASRRDNTSYLEAGPDLINLLSAHKTERIDRKIYEDYFMKGLFVDGINATLNDYRNALAPPLATTQTLAQTTAPTTEYKAPVMQIASALEVAAAAQAPAQAPVQAQARMLLAQEPAQAPAQVPAQLPAQMPAQMPAPESEAHEDSSAGIIGGTVGGVLVVGVVVGVGVAIRSKKKNHSQQAMKEDHPRSPEHSEGQIA